MLAILDNMHSSARAQKLTESQLSVRHRTEQDKLPVHAPLFIVHTTHAGCVVKE